MIPASIFVALLLLTVALLVAVVATGLRAARRAHLTLVAITLVSLLATVWAAERLGATRDFSEAGAIVPVHLTIAKAATLAYLLPVATGIATLRRARWRPWHRAAALATLALTVAAAVTGVWMVAASEPRQPEVGALPAVDEQREQE